MTTTATLGTMGRVPVWTLQDRLRKARESAGLSQAALAREIGVSSKTVHRAEIDGVEVRRPTILAWAMATGVDADWLLPRLDSNQQPAGWRSRGHLELVELAA